AKSIRGMQVPAGSSTLAPLRRQGLAVRGASQIHLHVEYRPHHHHPVPKQRSAAKQTGTDLAGFQALVYEEQRYYGRNRVQPMGTYDEVEEATMRARGEG